MKQEQMSERERHKAMLQQRKREKAAKALAKKQSGLVGEMKLAEEERVRGELAMYSDTGSDDMVSFEHFREVIGKRHAQEMSALQAKQVGLKAQKLAAAHANGENVDALSRKLDEECKAESNALEVAHSHGSMQGMAKLVPGQYNLMQQQTAHQAAAKELSSVRHA